jgi:serine/threonine-protein kinase
MGGNRLGFLARETSRLYNTLPTSESDYRAVAELGRGGQAVVTLSAVCTEGSEARLVVLKRVRSDLADDPEYIKIFAEQGELMARLRHDNVLESRGFLNDKGQPILATEYLQGQPLSKVVEKTQSRNSPMPLALHLWTLRQATAGLAYVHSLADEAGANSGLCHLDVSPRTIFVTYDGEVKVLDFGVARLNSVGRSQHPSSIRGKFTYTAPEHFEAAPLDQRADVFALGVMLWEALAGRRMWAGRSESDLTQELSAHRVPDLLEINPKVDRQLAKVCLRAIGPAKDERYQSASALLEELEAAVKSAGLSASQAELGAFVSRAFADKRAQAQRLLSSELKSLQHVTGDARAEARGARRLRDEVSESRPLMSRTGAEVLVIDDSELSREVILELLQEAGIEAIAAPTAVGAMKKVIRRHIHVVVTDVNMPKLTGNDLVSQLRRNPKTRDAKVVLVSALPPAELYEVGRRVRSDGVIEKDRLDEELVPIVKNLLRYARFAAP